MTPFASAHFIDADCQSISFDDIPLVQALLAPVSARISELEALGTLIRNPNSGW